MASNKQGESPLCGINTNRPEAWGRLYGAASRLAAYMGAHGSVDAKSDLGALLLEALDGIDGANYCPGLMPTVTDKAAGPDGSGLSDGLGLLPKPTIAWPGEAYTPTETRDYALREVQRAVAAERERCALLCETWMEAAERESGPEAAGWLHQIAQHMRGGNWRHGA